EQFAQRWKDAHGQTYPLRELRQFEHERTVGTRYGDHDGGGAVLLLRAPHVVPVADDLDAAEGEALHARIVVEQCDGKVRAVMVGEHGGDGVAAAAARA